MALIACVVLAARPAAQPAALPDRDTFLEESRQALARSQQLWHRYAYRERRTELNLNPFGRMGTGGIRVFEVRPSPNPQLTYRRLIERNGVPVSQRELDQQEADYRARVARIERSGHSRQTDDLANQRAKRMVDDVLGTLQFELVRREYKHGRPLIVVSFTPKPNAKPVTREGRLATAFQGHVWIDEERREITDMRAVAIDDVSFVGFLAKVYKGTEAVVERREVEPGVWMPTRLTLTGDVRALFRKARINHVIEWFDYRSITAAAVP